ncbi:helix-turn-helix transcriptional regulator [Roseateles cavernae]|uniref:helix-turn-helix transcriptional regulator n=1 Tax=Roseateles cavernae TaxID=3153578 RepID=UPI0032E391FD
MALQANRQLATAEFWRDERLPRVEMRSVRAGHGICYARHFHDTVTIGAIVQGACLHSTEQHKHALTAGTLVVVNPGEIHDCVKVGHQPLSYLMLYVDASLVAAHQGRPDEARPGGFRPFASTVTGRLFHELAALHGMLVRPDLALLAKDCALHVFLMRLNAALVQSQGPRYHPAPSRKLAMAAEFIHASFQSSLKLEDIGAASGLSVSQLIRSFARQFGMSPHQYLTHRRIQFAKDQLRAGHPIAAVAVDAGFADQAHLQRTFKAQMAATPGQYQGSIRRRS